MSATPPGAGHEAAAGGGGRRSLSPSASERCLSPFQQQLPQRVVQLKLKLPKIGRGVVATPRLIKRDASAVRTYNVTVQPRGRLRKAKELLREDAPGLPILAGAEEPVDNVSDNEVDRRLAFRSERARRFAKEKLFPVIVGSSELVPQWSPPEPQATDRRDSDGSPRREGHEEKLERLARPTHSVAYKKVDKKQEEKLPPWTLTNTNEAKASISDRGPCLFEEKYDAIKDVLAERQQEARMRQQMISSQPLRPGCGGLEELERHRQREEVHERSRDCLSWLEERYRRNRMHYMKATYEKAMEREAEGLRRAAQEQQNQAKARSAVVFDTAETSEAPAPAIAALGGFFGRRKTPHRTQDAMAMTTRLSQQNLAE
eukprot:TRINITY_DN27522_c1_g1_i1.p1 TRINITY_DN27522_c1_g1~~TRINITY_DN27522_c1_g1_i1.p1  ORF type:complete len:373 (+),score=99.40 TRINITY_DN27522_c1_g1_i1:133-1251(+)